MNIRRAYKLGLRPRCPCLRSSLTVSGSSKVLPVESSRFGFTEEPLTDHNTCTTLVGELVAREAV